MVSQYQDQITEREGLSKSTSQIGILGGRCELGSLHKR